jgi:hypothetical protein
MPIICGSKHVFIHIQYTIALNNLTLNLSSNYSNQAWRLTKLEISSYSNTSDLPTQCRQKYPSKQEMD